jgi:hypothetical protein
MEKSLRYNENKPKWSLVHYKSLEPMVRVLEMGAVKYSPDNWKIGLNRDEILESTMRHLTALMDGELLDKESGMSHMAHIQCNAMFYNYHEANNSFTRTEEDEELKQSKKISEIFKPDMSETNKNDDYVTWSYKDTQSWSERKKATFLFFNEFPEPWRSQAMKNYDEEFAPEIPENKVRALLSGFDWGASNQERDYWVMFRDQLESESA